MGCTIRSLPLMYSQSSYHISTKAHRAMCIEFLTSLYSMQCPCPLGFARNFDSTSQIVALLVTCLSFLKVCLGGVVKPSNDPLLGKEKELNRTAQIIGPTA